MLRTMCDVPGLSNNKQLINHAKRKHTVQKLRDEDIAPTDIMQITGYKKIILNWKKNIKKCSIF
jgi:hypothetical protein